MTKEELAKIDEAIIAAALAQRPVTKIPTGQRALDLTDREWGSLVRGNKRLEAGALVDVVRSGEEKIRSEEDRRIAERHFVMGINGDEHCRNGLGEWIY